ncbi:MAG: hypothetical protein V4804_08135 [Pseudomonadota bacterium]|jgi:hypothetical protein
MDSRFKTSLQHISVGSGLVLMAYGLSEAIHPYIHPQALYQVFGTFKLVYLPLGVLVLLGWVYGWFAVPVALPASLLSARLILGADGFTLTTALLITLKVCAVPLTFDIFRLCGIDSRGVGQGLNWRVLFLIGLVASVFSNLLRFWLGCCGTLTADQLLLSYTGAVIGDMVGLVVVMVGAMLFFRALRHRV